MGLDRRIITHFLISLILIIFVLISPQEGMDGLQVFFLIIIGLVLSQWYVIFGLIAVRCGYNGSGFDKPVKHFSPVVRVLVPLLISGLIIIGVHVLSGVTFFDSLVIVLYVVGPTLILFWKRGLAGTSYHLDLVSH